MKLKLWNIGIWKIGFQDHFFTIFKKCRGFETFFSRSKNYFQLFFFSHFLNCFLFVYFWKYYEACHTFSSKVVNLQQPVVTRTKPHVSCSCSLSICGARAKIKFTKKREFRSLPVQVLYGSFFSHIFELGLSKLIDAGNFMYTPEWLNLKEKTIYT